MATWVDRIKLRMKELGMTQEVLAQKLGITRGAVTHYIAGRRVPPLKQFQKLAAVLKSDPAWLQFGGLPESIKASASKPTDLHKKSSKQFPIPIVSPKQITELTKVRREETKNWLPHFHTDKENWYAMHVKGDSMTSPLGNSISFQEGSLIIIDPDKEPTHGNFVIALLPKSNEATFKQYVNDGGIYYLKPLNPQYPITKIEKGTLICGVVVSCIMDL